MGIAVPATWFEASRPDLNTGEAESSSLCVMLCSTYDVNESVAECLGNVGRRSFATAVRNPNCNFLMCIVS